MVIQTEPLYTAWQSIRKKISSPGQMEGFVLYVSNGFSINGFSINVEDSPRYVHLYRTLMYRTSEVNHLDVVPRILSTN